MPQSLSKIYIHIIFSTKNRNNYILPEIQNELYSYIASILKSLNSNAIKIGGTDNHIHVLCNLSKTISVSKIIEEIKKRSSKWIKTKDAKYSIFSWQNGYGVFSVSQSKLEITENYILEQKEHHKKIDFKDELRKFLKKHNTDFDEQYLWD